MCAGVHLSCAPRWAASNASTWTLADSNRVSTADPIAEQSVTGSSSASASALAEAYQWREHWLQAVYYPSRELAVARGQRLRLDAFHDEFSLWFDWAAAVPMVQSEKSVSSSPPVKQTRTDSDFVDGGDNGVRDELMERTRPLCTCGFHTALPRRRIAQLNRSESLYRPLVEEAAKAHQPQHCFNIANSASHTRISSLLAIHTRIGAGELHAKHNRDAGAGAGDPVPRRGLAASVVRARARRPRVSGRARPASGRKPSGAQARARALRVQRRRIVERGPVVRLG